MGCWRGCDHGLLGAVWHAQGGDGTVVRDMVVTTWRCGSRCLVCASGLHHLDGTMLRIHTMMSTTCEHQISFGLLNVRPKQAPAGSLSPSCAASVSASNLLCCTEPNPVLASTRTLHQKLLFSPTFWRTQQTPFHQQIFSFIMALLLALENTGARAHHVLEIRPIAANYQAQ